MKKPNFLIIGVQKAGTTYLSGKLKNHLDVFVSDPKELLFFQKTDIGEQDFNTYLECYFSKVNQKKYINESSAIYLQWPNALENIKKFLGTDIKIIVCLRQPTDRAVSFYLHNYKKGRFSGSESILDVAKGDIRLSPVESSFYAPYIQKLLHLFKPDNISFQLFDDLLDSPQDFVNQATDFLSISQLPKINEKAVNKGFELVWENDSLTLNKGMEGKETPVFDKSTLEKLHSIFQEDIDKTAKLIGRDLSHWKEMPEFSAKQKNW
jgi:hypothetical protein